MDGLRIGFIKKTRKFVVYMPMDGSALIYEEFKPSYMMDETCVTPLALICPNYKLLGPELLNKLGECFSEMAGIRLTMYDYEGYHEYMRRVDDIKKLVGTGEA